MIRFKKIIGPFYKITNKRSADDPVQITGDPGIWGGPTDNYALGKSMNIAAVYRCVGIKAAAIAGMGLHFLRRKKQTVNGVDHDVFAPDDGELTDYLLSMRPNPVMSAFDMIYNVTMMLDLQGNAYILPLYQGGELYRLILLKPGALTMHDIYRNTYTINDPINGISTTVGEDDILHFRNCCLDGGYDGVSTLHFAANTLNIAYQTDVQQRDMFDSGNTLRGFISGDQDKVQGYGEPQDKQLSNVSDRVESQLKSGKRIFSLPGVMKFNQISMSPADMQLLDSKKFSVEEICRFFGVPPDKVFYYTSTNYKSAENSQTTFMTDTLMPLMRRLENEFNTKLIGFKNCRKFKIKFNLDNYYESDPAARASYYQKEFQSGVLTPNEIRALEGLAPVKGGDTTFVSCNVAPIDSPKISDNPNTPQQKEGAKTNDSQVNVDNGNKDDKGK